MNLHRFVALPALLVVALLCAPSIAEGRPSKRAKSEEKLQRERYSSRAHILHLKHHPQSTAVWCWAASIAMVSEFLSKNPVSDCDVASKLDYANGGDGRCCDSEGRFRDGRCLYGRRTGEMTQVMNRYFGLTGTDFDRPMRFDELEASIDAGYPVIARLYFGGGLGHAIVLVGYEKPNTVIIDDPADHEGTGLFAVNYRLLARRLWVGSWYFRQDEIAGYYNGGGKHEKADTSPKYAGPMRSSVSAVFPKLSDPPTQKFVEQQTARQIDKARDCYDAALTSGAKLPDRAMVRLSFAVEGGTPTWIMTKDSGGLPASVTQCLSESLSKWRGLFPTQGDFGDSQQVELTFSKLSDGETAVVPAMAPAPK
jgi:hypothetical protein